MHCITLLHLGDTKTDHAPQLHPSIYANECIDHVREASSDAAFRYQLLLLKNDMHFLHCKFALSWCNCRHCVPSTLARCFFGFTINFVISAIIFFSSLVNRPAYGCPTKDFANS
ncbi:hypothetical protein HKD37_13G035845 [Glycine soja]